MNVCKKIFVISELKYSAFVSRRGLLLIGLLLIVFLIENKTP